MCVIDRVEFRCVDARDKRSAAPRIHKRDARGAAKGDVKGQARAQASLRGTHRRGRSCRGTFAQRGAWAAAANESKVRVKNRALVRLVWSDETLISHESLAERLQVLRRFLERSI